MLSCYIQATRYTKETEQKCEFGQNGRKLKHRKVRNIIETHDQSKAAEGPKIR